MAGFKKIAVLGKGMLGSAIVDALSKAGFTVTVFSRKASNVKDLPAGASVAEVDYSSVDSLAAALEGHDVAISTVGFEGMGGQTPVIEASIKAGVKRYIPCDWTTLSTDPKAQKENPTLFGIAAVQKDLAEKAAAGKLEYTIFSIGTFLETTLQAPLFVDFANHTATLYDDGKKAISVSSVNTIGAAVAAALKDPEASKNRNLFFHDTTVTQSQLIALGKKYSPAGTTWTVTPADSKAAMETSLNALMKEGPGPDLSNVLGLLAASLFSGLYNSEYKSPDNERFGLGFMSEAELEAKVAALYK